MINLENETDILASSLPNGIAWQNKYTPKNGQTESNLRKLLKGFANIFNQMRFFKENIYENELELGQIGFINKPNIVSYKYLCSYNNINNKQRIQEIQKITLVDDFDDKDMRNSYKKYIKYKTKYLNLKLKLKI